jgi:hypothetical protein
MRSPFFQLRVLDQSLGLLEHLDDDLLCVVDVRQLVDEEVLWGLHRHLLRITHELCFSSMKGLRAHPG